MFFAEDTFEKAVLQIFENLGYTHLYGPDLARDYSCPLLKSVLQDSLVQLNRTLLPDAITEAIAKLKSFDSSSLLQKNRTFMEYLQSGVPVRYFEGSEEQNTIVYLIDYQNVNRNCFYAVNQFTYVENGNNRRPDIVLFINGLSLVLLERNIV